MAGEQREAGGFARAEEGQPAGPAACLPSAPRLRAPLRPRGGSGGAGQAGSSCVVQGGASVQVGPSCAAPVGKAQAMSRIVLVTGGARSGKSAVAEGRTLRFGSPAVYIATAEAHDAEMAERIAAHRARRGPQWRTVAAPLDLPGALAATEGAPRLVDCLTLWLSNLMLAGRDTAQARQALVAALGAAQSPVVLVTNEVGWGIVPDNPLARRFRDEAGLLGQRVAAIADEVCLVACGLPLTLKG